MGRVFNTKRNIIWGIVQNIVNIFMPFLVRTVLIYTLGIEYTGLNSLFSSILSVLSFAELGFSSAIVFSMYRPIAEHDEETICALLAYYRKCYLVIGTIIVACGLAIIPFLDRLIYGDVPADINLYTLFAVYLLNNAIGYFLFAYKQALFTASQRPDVISKVSLAVNLLKNVTQILTLVLMKNYYAYVVVLPVSTFISNVSVAVLSDRYYPQYKCRGQISSSLVASIKKNVGGLLFQRIGNIVLGSADTIVISSFLGLRILGIYNGYYLVISALMGIMAVIQSALVPSVGNSIVEEDKDKNYQDFCKFHFLYLWIVSWFCVCLVVFYQPFIRIWQGEKNMLGMNMVWLMTLYFFAYKMGDMSYVYKEAIGLWWEGKFIPIISSGVNLTLNIVLVNTIGLPGIVISTIASAALINTPFGSRVLFKYYFQSKRRWEQFLIDTYTWIIRCATVCMITFWIADFIPDNIPGLCVKLLLCIIMPNILYILLNCKNKDYTAARAFIIGFFHIRKSGMEQADRKQTEPMSSESEGEENMRQIIISNIRKENRGGVCIS